MTSPLEATNQDAVLESHSNQGSSSTAAKPEDTATSDARFFQRSESVIFSDDDSSVQRSNEQFFGEELNQSELMFPPHLHSPHPGHHPWGAQSEVLSQSLHESYPLASQPHLLQPFARKENLFSSSREAGRGGGGGRKLPVSYAHQSLRYGTAWDISSLLSLPTPSYSCFPPSSPPPPPPLPPSLPPSLPAPLPAPLPDSFTLTHPQCRVQPQIA